MPDNTIAVPLTVDDLEHFCRDMASELASDMRKGTSIDGEDFAAVLKAWREYSPSYVQDCLESEERQKQRGFRVRCGTAEEHEDTRAMHDETADRLERLLPYLEASHG